MWQKGGVIDDMTPERVSVPKEVGVKTEFTGDS